jgi:hypothetical protein
MSDYKPGVRTEFVTGAFALLDTLGFKGIWKSRTRTQVLATMRRLRAIVDRAQRDTERDYQQFLDDLAPPTDWVMCEVMFVSDSLFVGTWHHIEANSRLWSEPDPLDHRAAISLATYLCSHVIREALADEVTPLKFRGVLTYGQFYMSPSDGFVVGPAVDEVATLERAAEGAFVWLTESALSRYPSAKRCWGHAYAVPLKNAQTIDTFVIHPFGPTPVLSKEPPDVNARLLAKLIEDAPTGSSQDVHVKINNVRAFYKHATPDLFELALALPSRAQGKPAQG